MQLGSLPSCSSSETNSATDQLDSDYSWRSAHWVASAEQTGALADRRPETSLQAVSWTVFISTSGSLVALGALPNPLVSAAALAVTSAAFAVWNVFIVSARQRATPNDMLGRVGAAYRTIVVTASLLGAIIGGIIADLVSIRGTLVTYGVLLALVGPFAARQFASANPTSGAD